MKQKLVSILIPIYQEGAQILENVRKVHNILEEHDIVHEFVLVDDGSGDDTWDYIVEAAREIPKVHAIRLSRNFGKEAALYAGIDAVKGDACVIMDADLQHPPELIPEMVRLWVEDGFEIVEGVKATRGKEKAINTIGAKLFYKAMKKMSGFDLMGASDFKLLSRQVILTLREFKERNTFFRGISVWVGFKRTCLSFEVAERTHGQSKWSLLKLLKLSINAITAYTAFPLQIVTIFGLGFLVASFLLGLQTLFNFFSGIAVSGFTTVILLILIVGSMLMISLGIIGTYIAQIYDEVKDRPRYVIGEQFPKSTLGLNEVKDVTDVKRRHV